MFADRTFWLARRWSNRELKRVAQAFKGDIVNVSGWQDRDKEGGFYRSYFPDAASYAVTNHVGAGDRGFQRQAGEIPLDLTAPLPDELKRRFDVVFNHTVLEHIFEVGSAFANLCALSRDVVIVVVPFSQLQHENASYGDYWRFTPSALRRMFQDNGFTIVYESESPQRNAAIYLFFVASRNPERYRDKLPPHQPIKRAGRWIGSSVVVSGIGFVRTRAARLWASIRT